MTTIETPTAMEAPRNSAGARRLSHPDHLSVGHVAARGEELS